MIFLILPYTVKQSLQASVCIPRGEYCSNFPELAESFSVCSVRVSLDGARRITGQMEETGGMTGNNGFEAMQ